MAAVVPSRGKEVPAGTTTTPTPTTTATPAATAASPPPPPPPPPPPLTTTTTTTVADTVATATPTTATAATTTTVAPPPLNPYAERAISNFGSALIPQLTRIFAVHSSADGRWHKADLLRFLGASVQGDEKTPEALEAAAAVILSESGGGVGNGANADPALDLKGFLDYMASAAAQAQAPLARELTDLSWPLANYYISSSHNTYLTGNQLYSDSSTDAYTNVLRRGCRCIEVDVWDGDESDVESVSSDSSASANASGGGGAKVGGAGADGKSPRRPEDEEGISKEEKKRRKKERKEKEKFDVGPDGLKLERKKKKKTWERLKDKFEKVSISGSGSGSTTAAASTKSTAATTAATTQGGPVATIGEKTAKCPIEPQVFHGYTLTKEVPFRDVCYAIRDSAFLSTDLPLIVSLETHCGPVQQEKMAEIMREAWAGMLAEPPAETDVNATHLPTPQDLRRKILVKCKYAPPPPGESEPGAGQPVEPSEATAAGDFSKYYDEEDMTPHPPEDAASTPTTAAAAAGIRKPPPKPSKIVQALSRMGIYTRGVTFKSLTQPEASMPTHIFSLSEKRVLDVHEDSPARLFEHNRRFLMRTYPSGMRIRSSNLDPPVFWRKGLQVVALNWQRWDEGMMLNEAMFAGTGGYVLKPEGYRASKDPTKWDVKGHMPQTQATAVPHRTLDLVIEVLAAQDIPLPDDVKKADKFDPYVKVELHISRPEDNLLPSDDGTLAPPGAAAPDDPVPVPPSPDPATITATGTTRGTLSSAAHSLTRADQARTHEGEYKARTTTQRGNNPSFNGEALRFDAVPDVVDELAFVRFTVWDNDFGRDDLAAWACVRLDRLKTGYRFVPLMNMKGVQTPGVILVKISKVLR